MKSIQKRFSGGVFDQGYYKRIFTLQMELMPLHFDEAKAFIVKYHRHHKPPVSHAKDFIKVLELTPFGGRSTPLKRSEIIQTRNGVNTFFHRLLALKFAAWLDTKFELWVYQTIDEILFGAYRRMEESLRLSAQRKNRIEDLKNALGAAPEFLELQRLELEERQASYGRTKENRNQLELFRVKGDLFK